MASPAESQSELGKSCDKEIGLRFQPRQLRRLKTAPTITMGATARMAMSGDRGLGVINSINIPETIQSVARLTAKSNLGTRSQYKSAKIAAAGAIAAPII